MTGKAKIADENEFIVLSCQQDDSSSAPGQVNVEIKPPVGFWAVGSDKQAPSSDWNPGMESIIL